MSVALRTPLVLPRVPPPEEGGVAPHLRLQPHDETAWRLAEGLQRLDVPLPGPISGMRAREMRASGMAASGVIAALLKAYFRGSAPVQSLHLTAVGEGPMAEMIAHLNDEESRAGEAPSYVYVTCEMAGLVDVYPLRSELVGAIGEAGVAGLLRQVSRALDPLMPTWGPSETWEHVRMVHWMGWDDESERLEEARCDLAQTRGVDEADVPIEDAREALEGYVLTSRVLAERVPGVYDYNGGKTSKEALRASGLPRVEALLEAAERCRARTEALDEGFGFKHGGYYDELCIPWTLVLDVEDKTRSGTLTTELFDEQTTMDLQSGFAPAPCLLLSVDPSRAASMERFLTFLRRLRETHEACRTLVERLDPAAFPVENQRPEEPAPTSAPAPRAARLVPAAFLSKAARGEEAAGGQRRRSISLREDCCAAGRAARQLSAAGGQALPFPRTAIGALV